jgi:hypothetical protein
MPDNAPDPPPTPATPVGIVHALVASVLHDWRRAALLILLGAAGLGGLLIYEDRARLTAAIASRVGMPAAVGIARDRVPAIAAELRAGLPDVRAVLVWHVDAEANRRALIGYDADADVTRVLAPVLPRLVLGVPLLRVQPGAGAADVNGLVLGAINGVIPCGAPGWPAWNRVDETPPPFPIGAVCLAGIPPEPGAFIGLLEVVFAHAPDAALLDALRPVLWHAADRLAGRDAD